jgi:hypothetical protein
MMLVSPGMLISIFVRMAMHDSPGVEQLRQARHDLAGDDQLVEDLLIDSLRFALGRVVQLGQLIESLAADTTDPIAWERPIGTWSAGGPQRLRDRRRVERGGGVAGERSASSRRQSRRPR